DALKEGLEAVRLSPNNTSARDNLIESFIGLGQIDEAEQATSELEKINPEVEILHTNRYLFAFLRGDQAAMNREVEWAKGKPEEDGFTSMRAQTGLYFGKSKEAEQLQQRATELYKNQGASEASAAKFLVLGLNQMVIGRCQQGKDNAKAALALARSEMTM